MNTTNRRLVALYSSVPRIRRIVFKYWKHPFDVFESFRPSDIREALKISLETIEEALPGALEKASTLDDKNFQSSTHRTRRYIAESPDLIYIDSPHLRKEIESVGNYYVLTNISWSYVPDILRLACKAAEIEYGSLGTIKF